MALKDNSKYGLLSKDSHTSADLSCVHVKLTDSALKFIEDILRSNRSVRPTLEVDDEKGIFRIPDGNGQKEFAFTVAPLPGDLIGSFDCIKQSSTGRLEALDSITQKITVKATDDVYQTTRDKLAEKNEESRKNCANILDNTRGAIKSTKVTKKIRRSSPETSSLSQSHLRAPSAASNSRSPNSHHVSSSTTINTSPPLPTSTNSNASHLSAINNNKFPTYVASEQTNAVKKLEKLKRKNQAKVNTAAKEAALSHSKSNGQSKTDKEKTKAALMARSLRERLLHLLAAKPTLDTPTILVKLRSEGVNSTHEHTLAADVGEILESIAATNSKGYWIIRPEHCSEVDLNWPFYSDPERQLVRRNLNRVGAKPADSTVHTTTTAATTTSTPKPVKRKKATASSEVSHQPTNPTKKSRLESDSEDYHSKYTKVSSLEQRNRYKDDFNQEYAEYKKLFDYMEGITQTFVSLAERLRATTEGTAEYDKVAKKIRKQYKTVTASTDYTSNKPRVEYLHRKLTHIKQLVSDFDQAQLLKC